MKKYFGVGALAATLLCGGALSASAHEVHVYEIQGVPYEFVVGSLGEPVIVDDKTGVDFELIREGKAVLGAQSSLQVEMSAGAEKRTVALSPVYGSDGRYKAPFISTVGTTLSYRFFGELEGTPVDLSFTCNPAGHPQAEADTSRVEISSGVVRTSKTGAFGCPQAKAAFGFPEPAQEAGSIVERLSALENGGGEALAEAHKAKTKGLIGVGLGGVALVISLVALFRGRKSAASTV